VIDTLKTYARLLLKTGVNLQPGQKLDVGWEAPHREFVRVLTEEAYALGAAYVNARLVDPALNRRRALLSPPQHWDFVPGWMTAYWDELVRDDWATIALTGTEDPQIYEGVEPGALGRIAAAIAGRRGTFLEALTKSMFCWNVAAVPTDGWARQVLGEGKTAADLWQALIPVLSLDETDPEAAWKTRIATLARRRAALDSLHVGSLRFTGPGTDLTVGLMPQSRWRGGDEQAANGRRFAPNLPTEEVFTTPDWRLTSGYAVCTRPVEVLGSGVEKASFVFREGRVVEFDAAKNRDVLAQYLQQDGQSNALGEVALVDGSSRIFRSGLVFHNILFDENAACHIALGSGYPDAVEGGRDLNAEERLAMGCNVSRVHTDFMIGGPEITVDATTSKGTVRLIDRGAFVPQFS
jgi:aminopeptidase